MATIIETIPPLCAGDHLSADEFLRRWEAAPAIKFAELLGGKVFMPSPVSADHGDMEGIVGAWLGAYFFQTPGTIVSHNATAFLLDDVPQPDVHLRLSPECGGKSWIEDGYVQGSPELVVEICKTSAAYDLYEKLELYQEAKVPEYLAVLMYEREIRWHRLAPSSVYEIEPAGSDGIHRSQVFPGLWLDGAALLEHRTDGVLAALQKGLASAEHRQFVETLSTRGK